jgi:pimeloyl-ACP methyl ester carboxylesterase
MSSLPDNAHLTTDMVDGIEVTRRPGTAAAHPVVLLHGIGSNGQSFERLMAALPASVDAMAWSAPGYGRSQPLAVERPGPADYADALLRVLDRLEIERIVLVGHSLGCLFAANFAARYPSRVMALALLSPALGYRVGPDDQLPPAVQARISEIDEMGPQAFAEKRAARLVFQPERKPAVLAAVRRAMAALNPPGYAQAVHALGAGDLLADAARIKAPTLIAVGVEDVVTPPANARALHAALTNAVGYHEIADAGHALSQEDPVALAALLMQLIEHHDA